MMYRGILGIDTVAHVGIHVRTDNYSLIPVSQNIAHPEGPHIQPLGNWGP